MGTMANVSAQRATTQTKSKTDSGSVTKRLQSELMSLMMSPPKGISAFPSNDNFFNWAGTIKGVEGTAYKNLTFKMSLAFPSDYPYSAPTVRFETSIFHPNVDQHGNICLDILKERWSAVYNVSSILLSIQSLLGEPNNDSPLNCQAAELWDNQVEFIKTVKRKYKETQH